MSSEWSTKRLGDVIEFVIDNRGRNPSSYETSGIPVIDNHLIISDGVVNLDNIKRYISEETYNTFLRKYIVSGDVLMTLVGNGYGKVALAPEQKSAIIQNTIGLRCNKEHCNSYLYYLLKINRKSFENLNRGAAQPSIKVGDILEVEFLFPPLRIQKKIAHSLRSIDKSIQLNRQTNQTLEHIAQALFKSWFVDFEPTRAKIAAKQAGLDPERAAMAAISGKTVAELEQLDAVQLAQLKTTAALFPDGLVESEFGEVPEGWELGELKGIAQFTKGRVDVAELTPDNYVSTENMLEGKKGISQASSLPSVKTVPKFKPEQVLISNIRPYFKKIWLARFEGGRSNDVLGIAPKDTGGLEHLYNLLYQDEFFNFMLATSKGAKMPRGDKDAIMGWICPQPPAAIKQAYSNSVKKFYDIIESNNKEIKTLEQLRGTLLPKLLSGEILPTTIEALA